ncbi:hypothetical protein [Mycobacterium sp. IS-1496]|uniref:hypothetical protein n=1 Tax=Mycobacterium sp. IS-1496 TaxID=1772284 RepID=UPI000B18D392|nr:hypothetical protein [Mycobacterium sp. IS-1496]
MVDLETLKLYHQESKTARERVEGLIDKYRANTSTLLALATAAVAFFGFSDGPRQQGWYVTAVVAYGVAVAMAFWIFAPIPLRLNPAHNTRAALFEDPGRPLTPEEIYYGYAVGHQEAITEGLKNCTGPFGLANRFRALIGAIALLVVAASLSVAFGAAAPTPPTHVIIDRTV